MSQPLHENIDVGNPATSTGDYQHPPPSAQNQESRGTSDFVDGSGHIFSMYLEMATEEDKRMAENWKDGADGILIFTGLFSAAVASLISVSVQDLKQNPQDTSNFYLANIYQATINPNESSSLPASPPQFTPPNYAIWVNALWFLSLVISITCALLATLLQQWARRYLKVTQPRYSPHKRARIRAFFAEGVDKFLLPWAVEALPTMLHLSLFLFFAGLTVFLWNVNLTIFKLVLSWIGFCTALYGCITFIPIFRHDSPYHTPLSLLVWQFIKGIPFLTSRALQRLTIRRYFSARTYHHFVRLAEGYRKLLVQGMQKTAEEIALRSPSEIDTRAFLWTFDSLDEDHELERFFAGLPGFRSSKVVKDPLPDLSWGQEVKLLNTWIGLLDRTSSSDLLPETVKRRRTIICRKAISPADIPHETWNCLCNMFYRGQYRSVQPSTIAHLVRGWDDGKGEEITMIIRAIVLSVVAWAQRRDDVWFGLASDEVGVPESVLRNHAAHGKNLSLAILIHVVRQQFSHYWTLHWPCQEFSKVLETASTFDVLDTSLELQNEFCALWNDVARIADNAVSWDILRPIRNIYLTLHLHTDSAPTAFSTSTGDGDIILYHRSSYPLCDIPGHHPDSALQIHNVSASEVNPCPVVHEDVALVPTFPPDSPSPSVPAPVLIDNNTMDVPLLNNVMSVPASSHPADQPGPECFSDFATSEDPLPATGATLDIDTSVKSILLSTPETLAYTASVPPISKCSLQNNADLLVHSNTPEIPSTASPEPVLNDLMESHCSILAATSPAGPPLPPFVPEIGPAECIPKAGPHGDKGALDPPSLNRAVQENTTAIMERPPLPQTLPSVADTRLASPSLQGLLDVEYAGDHPPHTSHGQHDTIV